VRARERLLVVLIAAHSYGVGLALLFLTELGARLGGFGVVQPLFFPRQAGAFHLVVATAYLIEYFLYGGVTILLTTKSIAVVFLAGMTALGGMPWVVPFSGVADGAMGVLLYAVHVRARPEGADRGPGGAA
jgi:hypothetical protein